MLIFLTLESCYRKEKILPSLIPLFIIFLLARELILRKKHKDRKTHRRRKRKDYKSDMAQADGTPFDWFQDGHMYSLHRFIDDAAGKVLGLYMCEHECLLGYLEATRQMLTNHGSPRCVYPDKYSVFFSVKSQKLSIEEQLEGKEKLTTQFDRIIDFLGIEMFPASTSQEKGRIERLWGTLQDRLITEFKINGIKTIEQANEFLAKYIKKYNRRFAVVPSKPENKFIPIPSYIDLDLLLTSKLTKVIDNTGTFTIKSKKFQILNNKILPGVKVYIYMSKKIGVIVIHNNTKMYCLTIYILFSPTSATSLYISHSLSSIAITDIIKQSPCKFCRTV